MKALRLTSLPDGTPVPAFGQGTWYMGETPGKAAAEAAALRLGLDLGLTLIDTAEMYGAGGAERIVANAIAGRRQEVFLVSKVLPYHATTAGTKLACEQSLKRLRTDRIDLYLLHWPGTVPIEETIAGFEALRSAGKICHWGVSNFDVADMERLQQVRSGPAVATNQVLYNLEARGVEFDLLPWCTARKMPVMAYTPLGAGRRLVRSPTLNAIAERHSATSAQVALAFLLQRPGVIVIPKAASTGHVQANAAAASLALEDADRTAIEAAYPPPRKKAPLAML